MTNDLKVCKKNPQHIWIAEINYCPYCNHTQEERIDSMKVKDIRYANRTRKKEKQPCYVCGKDNGITQQHHTTPLSTIKDDYENWVGEEYELIYLCPNCHAVSHRLSVVAKIKDEHKRYVEMARLFEGYSNLEFGKFMEVAGKNKNG